VTTVTLPATFTVGVLHRNALGGGGTLVVDRDSITLLPGATASIVARWTTKEYLTGTIQHAGKTVTVLCSRLPTPVANTTVLIEPDASAVYAASVPPWTRGRLLAALREAGFEVLVEDHWLANGLSRVR
jgi:hypothetical protein